MVQRILFPTYTNWKTIVKTKILEKEAGSWYLFCTHHPSMRVAEACLENLSPYQFWSIADLSSLCADKTDGKFWTYAGINFIHNHPPPPPRRTPKDLHQKLVPTLGLLHSSCCPGGGDLLGSSARGGHLSIKDFLPFFEIFIIVARHGDRQHFGVYLLL